MFGNLFRRSRKRGSATSTARPLRLERLESRFAPSVTSVLSDGVLTITGDNAHDNIRVSLDQATNQLVVYNFTNVIGRFSQSAVSGITINLGNAPRDSATIDPDVTPPAQILGGNGGDTLKGGGGPTTLVGGSGNNKLIAGPGTTVLEGGGGTSNLYNVKPTDTVFPSSQDVVVDALPAVNAVTVPDPVLTSAQIQQLIERAAGASSANNAIIAVVDRNGNLLGLRVEGGVSRQITDNNSTLVFAIDGALAEARTPALFSSNAAPLTSRTIEFISQSTITQREVESNPSITDPNSTLAGPGFVAPIGIGGHFPPNIPNTPQVDLYNIEGTNRDTSIQDGMLLPSRFNVPTQVLGTQVTAATPTGQGSGISPENSYGYISGLEPNAQPRGIGTLPGGVPIYEDNAAGTPILVGGIGVFFPGTTGYADAENSVLSSNYNPKEIDQSEEAEYMAFAAVGGSLASNAGPAQLIGTVAGIPAVTGISPEPTGRIDLVGVTLPLFGPGGIQGPQNLVNFGKTLGVGNPFSGTEEPVAPTPPGKKPILYVENTPAPTGWLVTPHDGDGITAAQVEQSVQNGIDTAEQTRSQLRLPLDTTTEMVFAVSDLQGNIVGLYRMPDAPVFSIGVAVAKARNVAYYDNPSELQPIDQLPGVATGTALTSRSFRYLAEPHFPEGINSKPPGPFSILNDGGTNPQTGMNEGPPLPASAFQSVQGYDAFHPNTNFRDPFNPLNQNGVVFFPGSSGLYVGNTLIGGVGVSGDGVDEDDVITTGAATGYSPAAALRIDAVLVKGIRVPYNKFDRNPQGGIVG